MATELDNELDEIERAISQLKRDFEMYFCGVVKQPPIDSRAKLDKIIIITGRNGEPLLDYVRQHYPYPAEAVEQKVMNIFYCQIVELR